MRTALVVSAHPDDEALGPGAFISTLASKGWVVNQLFFTNGTSARDECHPQASTRLESHSRQSEKRLEMARSAAEVLQITDTQFFDFPDNGLDTVPLLTLVRTIEKAIIDRAPELVITHTESDLNVDHQIINAAVRTATRPQPRSPVRTVLGYETPCSTTWNQWSSGTKFNPNFYVDVKSHISQKMAALHCYQEEMRDSPHPRSYDGVLRLAQHRGSSVGLEYAEAFECIRMVRALNGEEL